jgi:hypothetical protein
MTFSTDPRDEVRVSCCALPYQEEGRRNSGVFQYVQDLRRVDGIRPIIECQRHVRVNCFDFPDYATSLCLKQEGKSVRPDKDYYEYCKYRQDHLEETAFHEALSTCYYVSAA